MCTYSCHPRFMPRENKQWQETRKELQFYSTGRERDEGRGDPAAQRHKQYLLALPSVRSKLGPAIQSDTPKEHLNP